MPKPSKERRKLLPKERGKRPNQKQRHEKNEERPDEDVEGFVPENLLEKLEEFSEQDMDSSTEEKEDEFMPNEQFDDVSELSEQDMDSLDDDEESEEEVETKKEGKISRRQRLKERMAERTANESRTLFIGNAPPQTTRKAIRKMFRQFGRIEAVYQRTLLQMTEKLTKLMESKDKTLGERLTSTNFFVRFSSTDEAIKAADKMNGTELDRHTLRVMLSTRHKFDNTRAIFVGNLPFSASDDEVRAQFAQCGAVSGTRLLRDRKTGLGTGVGYVEFEQKDSVAKALAFGAQTLKGRMLRVSKVFKKKKQQQHVAAEDKKQRWGEHRQEIAKGLESVVVLKRNRQNGEGKATSKKPISRKVQKVIEKRRKVAKKRRTKSLIS